MNYKILWFFILTLTLNSSLVSQTTTSFSTSTEILKNQDEVHYKTVSYNDSTLAIINKSKESPNTVWYYHIDTNASLLSQNKIDIPCDKLIDVFTSKNDLKVAGTYFDKDHNEDQLLIYTINKNGELINTLLLGKSKPNGGYHSTFHISQSPDKSKYAVVTEKAYIKESKEEIILSTYNKDFIEQNHKDFTYTFPSLKRKVNLPVINNNGNVYLIKRVRIKRKNVYHLLNLSSSGVITHADIKLKSKPIADMTYMLNEDGELIVAGFYSNPLQFNFEGTYIKKYNESTESSLSKEFALPTYLVETFKSKKEISKTGYGLEQFHCQSLSYYEDVYYLEAEHITVKKEEEKTIENRDGIALIGFTKSGDFKFASGILLNQQDEEHHGHFNSFFPFILNGYKIWYNEVGYFDKKADNNFGENVLFGTREISVNDNGQTKSTPIQNFFSTTEEIAISIKSCNQTIGKLIILAENKERNKLYFAVSK